MTGRSADGKPNRPTDIYFGLSIPIIIAPESCEGIQALVDNWRVKQGYIRHSGNRAIFMRFESIAQKIQVQMLLAFSKRQATFLHKAVLLHRGPSGVFVLFERKSCWLYILTLG